MILKIEPLENFSEKIFSNSYPSNSPHPTPQIPGFFMILKAVDREDQKVPSILNTKIPVIASPKISVDREVRRSREIRISRLHFSYEKQI